MLLKTIQIALKYDDEALRKVRDAMIENKLTYPDEDLVPVVLGLFNSHMVIEYHVITAATCKDAMILSVSRMLDVGALRVALCVEAWSRQFKKDEPLPHSVADDPAREEWLTMSVYTDASSKPEYWRARILRSEDGTARVSAWEDDLSHCTMSGRFVDGVHTLYKNKLN